MKNLQAIYVLFFLTLWFSYQFVPIAFHGYFELNRTDIALKFCENLGDSKSTCNGTCFFKKSMAKMGVESNDQSPTSNPTQERISETFPIICQQIDGLDILQANAEHKQVRFLKVFALFSGYLNQVEHPPCNSEVV